MRTYPSQRSVEKMMRLDSIIKHGNNHSFTVNDISELLSISRRCAEDYIRHLRQSKQIYVCKWQRTGGSMTLIFKSGDKPDAEKPKPMTRLEYDKRYKENTNRKERKKYVKEFKPRRDIAASWF